MYFMSLLPRFRFTTDKPQFSEKEGRHLEERKEEGENRFLKKKKEKRKKILQQDEPITDK